VRSSFSALNKAINTLAEAVTMLRTTTTRPILKGLFKVSATRSSYNVATSSTKNAITTRWLGSKRPRAITSTPLRLGTTALLRYATAAKPPFGKVDTEAERKTLEQQLQANPDEVSGGSSVRPVFEAGPKKGDEDTDMLGGIKADMVSSSFGLRFRSKSFTNPASLLQETIKDTFRLTDVPRESYYIGAAGVLPYLATSLSTVYLAWDINHAHLHGSGVLFSPETAHQLLAIIEPIQIGYGAVVSQNFLSILDYYRKETCMKTKKKI
jgi:hypothetical protein